MKDNEIAENDSCTIVAAVRVARGALVGEVAAAAAGVVDDKTEGLSNAGSVLGDDDTSDESSSSCRP